MLFSSCSAQASVCVRASTGDQCLSLLTQFVSLWQIILKPVSLVASCSFLTNVHAIGELFCLFGTRLLPFIFGNFENLNINWSCQTF